ncbi:MAG: RNA polymerase sigma factor [Bacilli bacterium]|nr:RNA polymerase sigma factor [Bacilli bacterium]
MDKDFLRIFNMYKNDIYRLAYSYTKNFSDSDDIVQNVFIKLYKKEKILEKSDIEIKKWLIKVTINECKTIFLSSWKKKICSLTEKEENIMKSQSKEYFLLDEINKLSKNERLVIFLYYYENYKIKEISTIMKKSETNIQTILYRARNKLKYIIKEGNYNEK